MDTIGNILQDTSKAFQKITESPRLDAEVIIVHALGKNRSFLRAWPDKPLLAGELARIKQLVDLRLIGTPVAHLTGEKEFWSRTFTVSPNVLIPRPETELLIEQGLVIFKTTEAPKILDAGTGSGIIAITLAAEKPSASVVASDISQEALVIAKRNAEKHGLQHINFVRSDWFSEINGGLFDLIISNPPYIAENDPHLQKGGLPFEPKLALLAGPDGFDALEHIAERARDHLNPGGYLLLEHGYQQATGLKQILNQMNYSNIKAYTDLQGHLRVTQAQWRDSI